MKGNLILTLYESFAIGRANVHQSLSTESAGCAEKQLTSKDNFQITHGVSIRAKS